MGAQTDKRLQSPGDGPQSFGSALAGAMKSNMRQYTMIAALLLIWLIFTFLTKGKFLTPRNLSTLFLQMVTIGILTGGMLLVMVAGNIDLSVGAVCGTLGAVVAYLMSKMGVPPIAAVLITVALGALVGLWNGFWVAYQGVPAFIVTLASQITFRGITLAITGGKTIGEFPTGFKNIGQGYIPRWFYAEEFFSLQVLVIGALAILIYLAIEFYMRGKRIAGGLTARPWFVEAPKIVGICAAICVIVHLFFGHGPIQRWLCEQEAFHALSVVICTAAILAFLFMEFRKRRKRVANGFHVLPKSLEIIKVVIICAAVGALGYVFGSYRGISYAMVILAVVVAIYTMLTTRSPFGRHVYAIGGNREAARLSGVNIKRTMLTIFLSMGTLSGVASVVFTARLNAATAAAGNLFELDTIAACIIGGTSTTGGIGTVFGALIGALVMASLNNGMSLMNLDVMIQYIVKGIILLLAVWVDIANKRRHA